MITNHGVIRATCTSFVGGRCFAAPHFVEKRRPFRE